MLNPLRDFGYFTFIEIIVVVLILGIIAAVALPALDNSVSGARLDRATREVVGALEYAQVRSMSSGQACRVTIDAQTNIVRVERLAFSSDLGDASVGTLSTAAVENGTYTVLPYPPDPARTYQIQLSEAGGFPGTTIALVKYGAGTAVTFDALGMPSCNVAVQIEYRDRSSWVTVAARTGTIDSGP